MLCRLHTAAVIGVEAVPVEVEVDAGRGLPGFHLVGLPDNAVREGAVRIRTALAHSGFDLGSVRLTVNLAPAELRKDGASFDLPIALGGLLARGLATFDPQQTLLTGELALDGRLRPIRGALTVAEGARRWGFSALVLPRANASEAALVAGLRVLGADSLSEAVALLSGAVPATPTPPPPTPEPSRVGEPDFAEVCGQAAARRAAEVAAAGGHNLLLIGPPGAGKTMIARRIAGVLPAMSADEAIETTRVHSVAGRLNEVGLVSRRPFRAPHHTCSSAGLIGGGSHPRPGEVSLAHNGVLFLDELPEFQRPTLEALRQPLESGDVTIVRARLALTFPARFMLVAAMNPCPCGYRGSEIRCCTCGEKEAQRYTGRISGPLLDRFDIFVRVSPVPTAQVLAPGTNEPSAALAARVAAARERQRQRYARGAIHCNAQLSPRALQRHVPLSPPSRRLIEQHAQRHGLSARAVHRCCRVARTLADLEPTEQVGEEHVALALALQQERWLG
ncbi:MAG: YifB family Mg chelatase-like AAA ATPase [Proteobacteria bacterium]|nr:YifB family Mg chelatase-like AAA ATPase [Pseudomonadota bacterium]